MAVRFAFVGCGVIARHHLRALQRSSHPFRVTVAVDTDRNAAEEFKQVVGKECEVFMELPQALDRNNFDAAVLMVPHHLHQDMAVQCLSANKHVLLEKPLAHTVKACLRLQQLARETDQVFMLGEQSRYWPEVLRAKELIEKGVIGEPYFAQANYWESVGYKTFQYVRDDSWRYDPVRAGGGSLMDGTTHWVRPLRMWLGEITEVVGITARPFKLNQGETLGHALLRFSSGKAGVMHCHYMDIPMTDLPFFQIFGSEGEIAIHGKFSGGLTVLTKNSPKGESVETLGGYEEAFPPQMEEFLNAIVADRPLRESVSEGMGEVLFAKAVYKSLQTKQWESTQPDNLFNY